MYPVIISADSEWQIVKTFFPGNTIQHSPYGQWFQQSIRMNEKTEDLIFFQGGWGKIAAAGSAQYVIQMWQPELVINLGTCGGIAGRIEKGTIILADKTLVYDLYEKMGDYEAHIQHYQTEIDLSWLKPPYPLNVVKTLLVSADRDLDQMETEDLVERYGAVAADWESGAIAHIAKLNQVKCLILRGVSDLVDPEGGEAYSNMNVYLEGAERILRRLLAYLPAWMECMEHQ